MKKALSIIGMFVCSLFIFAACGIQGGDDVVGIKFVRDVFYVDYEVSTFLDYKVFPATAKGYYTNLAIVGVDDGLDGAYTLTNGYVTVKRPSTQREEAELVKIFSLKVQISVGNYSDTCEVRLREYPSSITAASSHDSAVGGTEYQIDVKGVFNSGERSLLEGEFNYKVTSSDESVILVSDEQNLRVKSTGRKGSATVTVQVLTGENKPVEGLKASITLDVEAAANDCFVNLGNLRLEDGGQYSIPYAQGQRYELGVRYYDEEGILISLADYTISIDGSDVLIETLEQNRRYLRIIGRGTATIRIQSNGVDAEQKPLKMTFKITVA